MCETVAFSRLWNRYFFEWILFSFHIGVQFFKSCLGISMQYRIFTIFCFTRVYMWRVLFFTRTQSNVNWANGKNYVYLLLLFYRSLNIIGAHMCTHIVERKNRIYRDICAGVLYICIYICIQILVSVHAVILMSKVFCVYVNFLPYVQKI